MATSGTVGQTVINTAKMLEHAWRRCGLKPTMQTPEAVLSAKESLYILMVHLANRGLNLWCVEEERLPLYAGQAKYLLPTGTLSVLNVLHSKPNLITGTVTSDASSYTDELDESSTVVLIGLKLATVPNGAVTLESSADGITWTVFKTIALADAPTTLTWYSLDVQVTDTFFRVVDNGTVPALSVTTFSLATGVTDVTVSQFNRDEYAQQPDKGFTSGSVTNYFFDKSLTPEIACWPVPSANGNFLSVWVHKQVQDVGSLSQEIAIPSRWMESILNQLSFRVAMEAEGVDPARITMLKQLSDESVIVAELDETDGSPIMIQPNISVYSR